MPLRACTTVRARSISATRKGEVEFEHVSFSYDGKRPAVADLSFRATPGETMALVGATGAGKVDRALAAASRLRSAVRRRAGSTASTFAISR